MEKCYAEQPEFVQRRNQLTGKNYRLPTEAEWEYAARGGYKSKGYKYAGSNNIEDVAWYLGNSSLSSPFGDLQPWHFSVGIKQPNELGLYDMSGNVWEWCQDWYGSGRVLRGGGYHSHATSCQVSYSISCDPSRWAFDYEGDMGFRLALSQ